MILHLYLPSTETRERAHSVLGRLNHEVRLIRQIRGQPDPLSLSGLVGKPKRFTSIGGKADVCDRRWQQMGGELPDRHAGCDDL